MITASMIIEAWAKAGKDPAVIEAVALQKRALELVNGEGVTPEAMNEIAGINIVTNRIKMNAYDKYLNLELEDG